MATAMGRGLNSGPQDDRTPLLGRAEHGPGSGRRDRGDLPYWRHILENRMTWEWYKVTLTSAAMSLLLFTLPYQNRFVSILGAILYFVALVIFVLTLLTHVVRFAARPSLLPATLCHDEAHHSPIFAAAFAVLVLDGAAYAQRLGTLHSPVLRAFFWAYVALAGVFSMGSSLAAFARPVDRASECSSHVLLPLVLSAAVAATAVSHTAPSSAHRGAAVAVMVVGTGLQGAGTLLSTMFLSNLLGTYQRSSYAAARERPAMFIAASLPALSAAGAFQLAHQALRILAADGAGAGAGTSLYHVGVTAGILFWGLAVWWFVVAVAANLADMDVRGSRFGGYDVVFGHVALFWANNELLRAFAFPRVLTVLNEVIGVATVVVYVLVVLTGVAAVCSGRFYRD